MVVLSVSGQSTGLMDVICRNMFEISSGLFVANLNKRIRDELWERVTSEDIKALMVFSLNNEQGFDIMSHNSRKVGDFEGLKLVYRKLGVGSKEKLE